ncbi:hypothetical protein ACWDY4_22120 [Streptomyces olivaceoviridis]
MNDDAHESHIKRNIAWASGILGTMIAIVSLYLTWPRPMSLDEWVSRANSVCDQDAGNITSYGTSMWRGIGTVWHDLLFRIPPQDDINKLIDEINSFAGVEQKLNGDLERIPKPGSRQSEIKKMLNEQAAGKDELYKAAAQLISADAADVASVENSLRAVNADIAAAGPRWKQAKTLSDQLGMKCT